MRGVTFDYGWTVCPVSLMLALLPAEQELEHGVGGATIGRAQQARAVEPALQENALAVGESLEAVFAVIGAHAGRADAAERLVLQDEVEQRSR